MPKDVFTRKLSASILFFAYNHERFVEEALVSALHQEGGDFELVVVDDASTDGTRRIIEEVLLRATPQGLRVQRLYKDVNGGLLAAVNDAMALATGDVFVIMAGDDVSMPDRMSHTLQVFSGDPKVQLVYGETEIIDEVGRVLLAAPPAAQSKRFSYAHGRFGRIYAGSGPCGAAAAYHRRLWDVFGPMIPGGHAEDNCFWVRALIIGEIQREAARFIRWRRHAANLSNYSIEGPTWRNRHLAVMANHVDMSSQWLKDIARARIYGHISGWRAAYLRYAAVREDATWRLGLASLRVDPWSLWIRGAWGLLRLGRFSTIIKMLWLRLSEASREKRWLELEKSKSNALV